MVIYTAGYSQEQLDQIKEASKKLHLCPYNTSFGVQMIYKNVTTIAKEFMTQDNVLRSKHHNRKIDAPSRELLNYYEVAAEKLMAAKACYDHVVVMKTKEKKLGSSHLRGEQFWKPPRLCLRG